MYHQRPVAEGGIHRNGVLVDHAQARTWAWPQPLWEIRQEPAHLSSLLIMRVYAAILQALMVYIDRFLRPPRSDPQSCPVSSQELMMDIAERASYEALASVSCRCRSKIAAADVECRPEVWWSSFSWCMMRHSKIGMFAPLSIYRKGFNFE